MQALVHHPGHLLRRVAARAREVGPPHVSDEKRVARQNLLRLGRDFGVDDDERDALGRVARRLQHAEPDTPDAQLVAVTHCAVWETCAGVRADDDLGAGARGQFPVAADEVRVQVRLDDVLDLQSTGGGLRDVLLNVALRVYDRGLALRTDEVGGVRQTAEIELLEVHDRGSCQTLQLT